MIIREETEADLDAISALNREVFGGDYEAVLIEKLRAAGLILASLVAVDGDEVKGHILFSRLPTMIDGRQVNAAALAPMAVSPASQRQGIGSKLVTEGLDRMKGKSVEAVIVLGHTGYYPRFGFSPALTKNFTSPFRGKSAFMGLELITGALAGGEGSINYPEAFGL